MILKHLVLLVTASLLAPALGASASPRYTIRALGALPGEQSSVARSINSSGDIVGKVDIGGGVNRPFIYHNGQMSYIQTPTGLTNVSATGINDAGQVVLWGITQTNVWQTYVWQDGKGLTQVGDPAQNIVGDGINNSGQVTGGRYRPWPLQRSEAYVTDNNSWTYIPGIEERRTSEGFAINDLGQVAGYCYGTNGNNDSKPIFWDGAQLNELPTLGGKFNMAWALNNNGQIVGRSSSIDGKQHGVLWQNGTITDLGTLFGGNTDAFGINSLGQVVGMSGDGFLWENGVMKNLNSFVSPGSGWQIETTYDINDSGMIVGVGVYQGSYRAFVMTPVPEPSSILALISGIAGVGGLALRRRK